MLEATVATLRAERSCRSSRTPARAARLPCCRTASRPSPNPRGAPDKAQGHRLQARAKCSPRHDVGGSSRTLAQAMAVPYRRSGGCARATSPPKARAVTRPNNGQASRCRSAQPSRSGHPRVSIASTRNRGDTPLRQRQQTVVALPWKRDAVGRCRVLAETRHESLSMLGVGLMASSGGGHSGQTGETSSSTHRQQIPAPDPGRFRADRHEPKKA